MKQNGGSVTTQAGTCRVRLEVNAQEAAWGEDVHGVVVLEGGSVPQTFWSVEAGVLEYPVTGSLASDCQRWERFLVQPSEERRLRCAQRVPWGVPFGRTLAFQAIIRPAWAWPQVVQVPISVCPPRAIAQVAEVLAEVARMAIQKWEVFGAGDGAAALLTSGETGPERVERLRLELFLNHGTVYGELGVEPRPRTIGGVVQGLVGADRQRYPVRFPAGDLEAARDRFQEALRPYVDRLKDLPIPAAQPGPPPGSLPRPSAASPASPEDLPRVCEQTDRTQE
jgi:hypothetical protein